MLICDGPTPSRGAGGPVPGATPSRGHQTDRLEDKIMRIAADERGKVQTDGSC